MDDLISRKVAAHKVRNACLVPPDGGSPTQDEIEICETAAQLIEALPSVEVDQNGPPTTESLTEPPETPDYRFGRLVKGEKYAYARGLTINPTHLPKALDAMEADGWSLLAIFGETDAENVGFIFRRRTVWMGLDKGVELPTNEELRNGIVNPDVKIESKGWGFGKGRKGCGDCDGEWCTMNCSGRAG